MAESITNLGGQITIRLSLFIAIACAVATSARGDWITSWGDGDPNSQNPDFIIVQSQRTITIRHGNGLNYKFYSETAEGSGQPGSIDNVTIVGANGDFTLLIDHPTPGEPGALVTDDWIDFQDLTVFLSTYGYTCPCYGPGFEPNFFAGSSPDDDPAFVAWMRQATPEEVVEWYSHWEEESDR